uniref:Uncharacterized protein n=1 Tax=Anguilla anguilla TaxID=7936 RepID=A0A0E9WU19_ANGAN
MSWRSVCSVNPWFSLLLTNASSLLFGGGAGSRKRSVL